MKLKRNKSDINLLLAVIALVLFGVIMVYSSSWPSASMEFGNPHHYIKRHLIFIGIGMVLLFIGSFINYHFYKPLAILALAGTWLACLLVFTPLGTDQYTFARRWIRIGGQTVMPSDFLKIGIILFLAWYFEKHTAIHSLKKATLPVFALIFFVMAPVMLQPDFSTSITITLVMMILFFIAGMNKHHVIPAIALGITGFFVLLKMDPERLSRWMIFRDPMSDLYGNGWQLSHSLFAVSSGGVFGAGIGLSRQKYILSQAHNDFIFAIIAEELGFIGSLLLILLYIFLVYRGARIAWEASDRFGMFLAYGITALIGIQALVNIAVVIGLIPPTGIALPFVSYGGSSVVTFMFMAGVLLNISKHKNPKYTGGGVE